MDMHAEDTCVFCRIVRGQLPATVLYEDERTLAFLDIFPGALGHTLVVPKNHAQDIFQINALDLQAVILTAQRLAHALRLALSAEGVNLFQSNGQAAFQSVFHLHVHILPRFSADDLVLPWTPQAMLEPAQRLALQERILAKIA